MKPASDAKGRIRRQVMKKINQGEIKMLPRWRFIVVKWSRVALTAGLLTASAVMFSVAASEIRLASELELGQFGSVGRSQLLSNMPWLSILLGLGVLVGLFVLLRKFEFSYKAHFVTIFLVIFISLLGIGSFAAAIGVSDSVGRRALSGLRPVTRFAQENRIIGRVVSVSDNRAEILAADGARNLLIWDKQTVMRHGTSVNVGDQIMALGRVIKVENETPVFKAFGISINPRRLPRVKGAIIRREIIRHSIRTIR